jgi:hypothetical protein
MENRDQNYRNLFFRQLRPFMDMLDHKQSEMDSQDWHIAVRRIARTRGAKSRAVPWSRYARDWRDKRIVKELFEDFIQAHTPVATRFF